MPRRLYYCQRCQRQFIASSTLHDAIFCQQCYADADISDVKPTKSPESAVLLSTISVNDISGKEFKDIGNVLPKVDRVFTVQEIKVDSIDAQNPEEQFTDESEAGEEIHCTQLMRDDGQEDDSSDDPDDEPLSSLLDKTTRLPRVTLTDREQDDFLMNIGAEGEGDNNLTTCMICGASLDHIRTGWKGRLNHLKRCAQTHGVEARDVRLNCEDDERNSHLGNEKRGCVEISGPDDGTLSLNQNVYNILMAGARRAAQKAKAKQEPKGGERRRMGQGVSHGHRGTVKGRQCPSYKMIPGTDFVCDGFYNARQELSRSYFLTHFHSDHYGGITRNWDAGTIYCSEATAKLVHMLLGVDRKYLHPLPLDRPTVVETLGRQVSITLMDANHCPGAVMFFFQFAKQRILHVGDFRWDRNKMLNYSALGSVACGRNTLTHLFLDTTYCDTKYTLPTQAAAIEAAVDMAKQEVRNAMQSNSRILLLFGAYTIGKERIYFSVAEHLGLKVYVDKRRSRILAALDLPASWRSLITSYPQDTCLWVVPLGHLNMKRMGNYLTVTQHAVTRTFDRVIGFRPTGWSLSSKGSGIIKSNQKGNLTIHNIPYSEHSSFPELVDCVTCLRPNRLVPTVSVRKSDDQVKLLMSHVHKAR